MEENTKYSEAEQWLADTGIWNIQPFQAEVFVEAINEFAKAIAEPPKVEKKGKVPAHMDIGRDTYGQFKRRNTRRI